MYIATKYKIYFVQVLCDVYRIIQNGYHYHLIEDNIIRVALSFHIPLLYIWGRMYVKIGSHFVPLECKFLFIALVIVRITLNVIVRQMPLNVG